MLIILTEVTYAELVDRNKIYTLKKAVIPNLLKLY